MTHSKKAAHAHWPKTGRRKAAQRSKAKARKKTAYPFHITPYGNG